MHAQHCVRGNRAQVGSLPLPPRLCLVCLLIFYTGKKVGRRPNPAETLLPTCDAPENRTRDVMEHRTAAASAVGPVVAYTVPPRFIRFISEKLCRNLDCLYMGPPAARLGRGKRVWAAGRKRIVDSPVRTRRSRESFSVPYEARSSQKKPEEMRGPPFVTLIFPSIVFRSISVARLHMF